MIPTSLTMLLPYGDAPGLFRRIGRAAADIVRGDAGGHVSCCIAGLDGCSRAQT